MKKSFIVLTSVLLILSAVLSGCSTDAGRGNDEGISGDSENSTGTHADNPPAEDGFANTISLLKSNGSATNINWYHATIAAPYHGGQQNRVVHTERGTYTAFSVDSGDSEFGIQKFYVAKVDREGNVVLLHYGEFSSDFNEILVNIAQDTNGDIIVTAASPKELEVHLFDSETDELSSYTAEPEFTGEKEASYSQVLFDFENRKLYAFYNGRNQEGMYLLEWFTFDLESREWDPISKHKWLDCGRHCYLYPFPDGNGGAYIVGQRDIHYSEPHAAALDVGDFSGFGYLFDEQTLFHIPDLSVTDNISYTTIAEAYEERGSEGIWSVATSGAYGDAFIDSDGYIHILYYYYLYYKGEAKDGLLDDERQYRHAVYDGMECVFNERIDFGNPEVQSYKPCLMQGTDGTLYFIACNQNVSGAPIEIYRAQDEIGRTWELVKSFDTFPDGRTAVSFSISAVRDGSLQDDTVSCFMYSSGGTITVFDISLEDFSVTQPVDVLGRFGLVWNDRSDRRIADGYGNLNRVIHTEEADYAALIYNHIGPDHSDQFHIIKIKDGKSEILYSGSYDSRQDRFLTMYRTPDGLIWVCPPRGETINNLIYTVDPETDEVREFVTGVTVPSEIYEYSSFLYDKVLYTDEANYIITVSKGDDDESEKYKLLKVTDGAMTEIYSGTYIKSKLGRHITFKWTNNGQIWLCLPTDGEFYSTVYLIDKETDEVTEYSTGVRTGSGQYLYDPFQVDMITDEKTGETRLFSFADIGEQYVLSQRFDTEAKLLEDNGIKYTIAAEDEPRYSNFYTFSDGGNGVYIVGTRQADQDYLGGSLTFDGHTHFIGDSIKLFHIPDISSDEITELEVAAPFRDRGSEGIWSVCNVTDKGDVFLDSEGRVHIFYTFNLFDFDDNDIPANPALVDESVKLRHVICENDRIVLDEDLEIEGLGFDSSVRMAESSDGMYYLLICGLNGEGTKVDVYRAADGLDGWEAVSEAEIGEFSTEAFGISSPRGGSDDDGTVSMIFYASDNDVYYSGITLGNGAK